MKNLFKTIALAFGVLFTASISAQEISQWTPDGNSFYSFSTNGIGIINLLHPDQSSTFLTANELIPQGKTQPLQVQSFDVSSNGNDLLLFANTKKVWRLRTRGDYWVFNRADKKLTQIGQGQPTASLMFAKFSPDGGKVAYVSKHNIYIENSDGTGRKQITTDGTDRMINGTFDWVYEEEFGDRDGFRWSPDGKKIAYWKVNATKIPDYLMLNTTDSLYSFTVPVQYPKVGVNPSAVNLWIYDLATGKTTKMDVPGDDIQHYIPRMEWLTSSKGIILQQLNRKQNESKIFIADANTGAAKQIHEEKSDTWIDIKTVWAGTPVGWDWLDNGKAFMWLSEKDGWRHIYKIDLKGKETLLTKSPFDVINLDFLDVPHKTIYFTASPDNPTQQYLYKVGLDGGKETRVTPAQYSGTNSYQISPNGRLAVFTSSSVQKLSLGSVVELPSHKELIKARRVIDANPNQPQPEFFRVTTVDGVKMDGWVVKPKNFDPTKKYPTVFYVYGEPAEATVTDTFGQGQNFLYKGDFPGDGYIYVSFDNEGSPAPRGANWRHSIYKNIGILNIRDQAMAAKEFLKNPWVDKDRVAVWGWSGGGASTLNLLGQYPEIYKTGIAIAPVTYQPFYDDVYQERYMGLITEDKEPFIKGSAVTYAKNVKGNLMIIHGSGDDNVHYQNTEYYINELIRHDIPFEMMEYPNRTHSISEGAGTREHLSTTYTRFLKQFCPPGAR